MNKTDPKSLHDAMRRLQVLVGSMWIDLSAYIDTDAKYDELAYLLRQLDDAQKVISWVRETFDSGNRREK